MFENSHAGADLFDKHPKPWRWKFRPDESIIDANEKTVVSSEQVSRVVLEGIWGMYVFLTHKL